MNEPLFRRPLYERTGQRQIAVFDGRLKLEDKGPPSERFFWTGSYAPPLPFCNA
jgi:hypothetical protein